jgi:glutamate-1-semialdehyde 2,1-aminomutase
MAMRAIDRLEARVFDAYRARTPKSEALFERAARTLPGGVSGNLRYFKPHPLYMRSAAGATMTDVDGAAYIDCFLCNGPMLLGHRHPDVIEAMARAEAMGSLVLNPAHLSECAEMLAALVPCAERVRFLNSGTEAVIAAVRYARAFTGRAKIIKFFGHYHGQDDQVLVGAGAERAPLGAGVSSAGYAHTLTLPFNDVEAVEAALKQERDVAAIILDPAMHSGGLWGASTSYLKALRALATQHGVVLIFDEVITGFRMAPGGAQQHHGVTPDLATFAKALGAGEKLAAVAGRADIMSVVDPVGGDPQRRAFQSGTGNDGTRALAAGAAAMTAYKTLGRDGGYDLLEQRTALLARELRHAFADAGMPCHINQIASMLQIFVTPAQARFETFAKLDQRLADLFFLALLTRGVMLTLPTSNHIYLSFEHTDAHVAEIAAAARDVLVAFDFADAYASASKEGAYA